MYKKLKEIRKENNILAIEMAKIIQLKTSSSYLKKENGNIKFSLIEAMKIAKYLNMSIEEIFFDV